MWGVFSHATFFDLWQPTIMIVASLLLIAYLLFTHGTVPKRLYGQRHITTMRQTESFALGCFVMFFSFTGPLDYLSDNYLFSAHMVQHMLEITIMTPLLMKGLPNTFYAHLWQAPGIGRIIRAWAHPLVAGAVFNIVLTAFHSPYLYNLALESDSFHLFEHAVFFLVASFMWAPLLVRLPGVRQMTNGQRLLYLLYNYNLMMPIGILLLVSNDPWYTFYVNAPRLTAWLTPIADIQLGAVIMLVFMGSAFLTYGIQTYARQDEAIWYA